MELNVEKYIPYLDEFDLTREEKEKVLHTLWIFMESQAEQAFGLHPVQSPRKSKDL